MPPHKKVWVWRRGGGDDFDTVLAILEVSLDNIIYVPFDKHLFRFYRNSETQNYDIVQVSVSITTPVYRREDITWMSDVKLTL